MEPDVLDQTAPAGAGNKADPWGLKLYDEFFAEQEARRANRQPAAPVEDLRPNTEKHGYKPMRSYAQLRDEGARGISPLTGAEQEQQIQQDYAHAAADQALRENPRNATYVGTPAMHGLTRTAVGLKQIPAMLLGMVPGAGDVSGAVLDQQRAVDAAADIVRGRKETGAESFVKNAVAGVTDLLALGGTLKKAGLGVKSYLAAVGVRSYDTGLKQADEAGLDSTQRHTFAAANAAAEVGTEAIFSKFGLGVMGKLFPGKVGAKAASVAAVKQTIAARLWDVAKTGGQEAIEEGLTQLAQNGNEIAHGMKPLTFSNLTSGVGEAAAVGGAVGGVAAGGSQAMHGAERSLALQQRSQQMGRQLPGELQQGQLNANRDASRQQQQEQAGAQAYARQYVSKLVPDTINKLADLTEPSRSAFAAAVDNAAPVPNREIRGLVVDFAKLHMQQRAAMLQTQQQAPAGAQPPVNRLIGQAGVRRKGQQPTLQAQTTPGQAFTEQQGQAGQATKPATWDQGLSPAHRNIVGKAAKEYGVDPAELLDKSKMELHQRQVEYREKLAIRQQFNLSAVRRGQLVKHDETRIPGYDSLLGELQAQHPHLSEEYVKDALKETRTPEVPRLGEGLVNHVASQIAQAHEQRTRPGEGSDVEGQNVPVEGVPFDPGAVSDAPAGALPPQGKIGRKGVRRKPVAIAGPAPGQGAMFNPPNRPAPTGSDTARGGANPQPETTMPTTGAKPVALEKLKAMIAAIPVKWTGKKGGIYTGHMSGMRGALGIFNPRSGAVRLKQAGNMQTLAHEIAHRVDYNTDILKGLKRSDPKAHAELYRLGKMLYGKRKSGAGYDGEGFAEFMRQYITSPADALSEAPAFHARLESLLASNKAPMPQVRAAIAEARQVAHHWFREMGAQERVATQLRNPHSFGEQLKAAGEKVKGALGSEVWNDIADPLAEFGQLVKEFTGKALLLGKDPHAKFKAYRQTFSGIISQYVHDGVYSRGHPDRKVFDSLEEILSPVSGTTDLVAKRDRYFYVRAAEEAWQHGHNPGISLDDARQVRGELETPELVQAADQLQKWIHAVNDQIGLYDRTIADEIANVEAAYSFYLPLKRVVDGIKVGTGTGGAKSGRVSAARHGSGLPVKDILPQLVSDKANLLRRAMQRDVVMTMIRTVNRIDPSGKTLQAFSHLIDEIPVSRGAGGRTNQVPADVVQWREAVAGGHKTRWYQVQPELQKIMDAIEPAQLKGAARVLLGIPTNAVKLGWMAASPRYGLIRNPMRDIPEMLIKSPGSKSVVQAGRMLGQYFDNWARALVGKDNAWMETAHRLGLTSSELLSEHNPKSTGLVHRLSVATKAKIFEPHNWVDGIFEVGGKLLEKMQGAEAAARIVAMRKQAEELGWKPGQPLDEHTRIALALAFKEPMGDYSGKGEFFRVADQVFPLASVPITYGRSTLQAIARNPKGFIATGITCLTIPTILAWLNNRDEEWYRNLPAYDKYSRIYVPVKSLNTAFLWFRNSEAGMLFSAIPEALLDAVYRKDPKVATELAGYMLDQYTPSAPPLAKEFVAQATNKDQALSGRPIVPERDNIINRPAPEQYDEQTSEAAKLAGKATGLSPMRIEHAARELTGGMTKRLTDTVETATGAKPATREQQLSDLPVVGGVFPSGGLTGNRPKPIEKLYELVEGAHGRSASVENPETDTERSRRLHLEAGSRAVSQLLQERAAAKSPAEREALMQKAVHLAEDATAPGDKGKGRFRGIERASEYRMETDPLKRSRMLYSRLEELSDTKPRLGHAGVTRENLERRVQAYAEQVDTGRTFVKEAKIDPKDALSAFREAIYKGIGPEKVGRIKSPEARGHRVRLLRQQLGA